MLPSKRHRNGSLDVWVSDAHGVEDPPLYLVLDCQPRQYRECASNGRNILHCVQCVDFNGDVQADFLLARELIQNRPKTVRPRRQNEREVEPALAGSSIHKRSSSPGSSLHRQSAIDIPGLLSFASDKRHEFDSGFIVERLSC